MILLDSLHTNNSGGRVLLNYLVETLVKTNLDVFYLFDERCRDSFGHIPSEKKIYLKANLINRYLFYLEHKNDFEKILCFSNLPPPMKLDAVTITFFHNVLFLDRSLLLPLKSRWILFFKRLYLNFHRYNTDFFFVQTQHVKKIVIDNLNLDSNKIHVLPFFQELNHKIDHASKKENKFLYVSDGNAHKNHRNLLRAWEIINKTAPHLQLYLTISNSYPNLLDLMESMKARGVNVINLGIIPKNELILEYLDSKYLIYPSTNESFGLGLIEGIQLGVEVIASDLPFVHNVCNPISVFNPFDVNSIVKSVLETVHDNSSPTTVIKINNEIEKWISFIS